MASVTVLRRVIHIPLFRRNRKPTTGLQFERPVRSYFKLYRRNCLSIYAHFTSRKFVKHKFWCQNLRCNRAAYFPILMLIILEFLVLYVCLYNINMLFLRINKLEYRKYDILKMFLIVNVKIFAIHKFNSFESYRKWKHFSYQ